MGLVQKNQFTSERGCADVHTLVPQCLVDELGTVVKPHVNRCGIKVVSSFIIATKSLALHRPLIRMPGKGGCVHEIP